MNLKRPLLKRSSLIIFLSLFSIAFFVAYYFLGIAVVKFILPSRDRPFEDLLILTESVDAVRAGLNPYTDTTFDLWGRLLNYPVIWLRVFDAINFTAKTTNILGIGMIVLFYVSVFIFIVPKNFKRPYWFVSYALLLISPAVLFLVERANIDIFLFFLLCVFAKLVISANVRISLGSYSLLLIGTVLKIYPVFAFTSMLFTVNKRKNFVVLSAIVAVLLSIYIYYNYEELMLISRNTPRFITWSFGKNVLFQDVFARLEKSSPLYLLVTPNLCFIAVVGTAFLVSKMKRIRGTLNTLGTNLHSRVLFVCGASIYIGTFFIGNNFDYRLVFLLLTVPMILEWSDSATSGRIYFWFIATAYFITFWYFFLANMFPYFGYPLVSYFITFVVEQLANWAILFVLFVMLFALYTKYSNAVKHAAVAGKPHLPDAIG